MSSEASAVITPQDSAPAPQPATVEQTADFFKTGKLPLASESAPDNKEKEDAVAESAPRKDEKTAVNRSDSATDKEQKSQRKEKDTESSRRYQELANENKTLKERLDALEKRPSQPEKREDKQPSQAAPEEIKAPPPLKQFLEQFFADAKNKGKSYEEGVEAWADAKDKFREAESDKKLNQRLSQEQQRIQQQQAAKELQGKVEEGKKRYADFDDKVWPSVSAIMSDQQVPFAVKAMLNRSDVMVDLLYAIGKDNVETFIALSKSDAGAAIEKLVELQADVRRELKAGKSSAAADDKKSSESESSSEKKGASETKKPNPPKAPQEVGGRGTVDESPDKAAARNKNFRAFNDAEWQKHKQA
jgi:hypothetical protein